MFNIGNVVSPQVASALIRRGENRGTGGGITRRDPTKRTEHTDTSAQDDLALRREERLRDLQDAQLGAQARGEAFNRERFKADQDNKDRDFEFKREQSGFKREAAQNDPKALNSVRKQGTDIIGRIASAMQKGNKINPDTGKPDPQNHKQMQQIVAALWQTYTNLGLPKEEVDAMRARLTGQQRTTPAARGGGIQRGGQPQQPQVPLGQSGLPEPGTPEPLTGLDVRTGLDERRENPDPPGRELMQLLDERGWLARLPQGAQLHNDGTMTLLDGQRIQISKGLLPSNSGNVSRGGGGSSKVEAGLNRELSSPNRTP